MQESFSAVEKAVEQGNDAVHPPVSIHASVSEKTPAIQLKNSSIGWAGKSVLASLNLTIHPGEKVALIGKSGAGKTTLLNYLQKQLSSAAGFCPQYPGLVPSLSVYHNIYMGQLDKHPIAYNAWNLFRPIRREVEAISALVADVGLQDKLFTKVEALSGGQQQRCALARALFQHRRILLADEPVSAVDERQAEHLLRLMMARYETVILAVHHIQQALNHCDRVIGLDNGRIVLDEQTKNLHAEDLRGFYQHDAGQMQAQYASNLRVLD